MSTRQCNNCAAKATHRCNYHMDPEAIAMGLWYYHCPKHLCPHCEEIP